VPQCPAIILRAFTAHQAHFPACMAQHDRHDGFAIFPRMCHEANIARLRVALAAATVAAHMARRLPQAV